MKPEEVQKIIDRLKSGYRYNRFDDKGVTQEFIKALIQCNYSLMNKAVDVVIKSDPKDSPSIQTLIKAYDEITQHSTLGNYRDIKNHEYCDVCDDKGFIEMVEVRTGYLHGVLTKNKYTYYPPCPFCEKGKAFAVKGERYLTDYFDEDAIQRIRMANRDKKELADEREGMALDTANIGNMPA
jgi:hypothetical protein